MKNKKLKSEEFGRKARHIADELNTLRLEVFQEPTSNDKDDIFQKDEINDKLFSLQSQIRDVAFIIENSLFVEDWK